MSSSLSHLEQALDILQVQQLTNTTLTQLHHRLRTIHVPEQLIPASQPLAIHASADPSNRVVGCDVVVELLHCCFCCLVVSNDHNALHTDLSRDHTRHHAREEARMLSDFHLERCNRLVAQLLVPFIVQQILTGTSCWH